MWDPKKARVALDEELRRRSGGPGTSDTTLARLSRLAEPEAARSRLAFQIALVRSGASRRQAAELAREVAQGSRTLGARVRPALRRLGRRPLLLAFGLCTVAFVLTGSLPVLLLAAAVLALDWGRS
jgi:hypothetical protein